MSKDCRPFQNGLRYLNTWKITSLQMVSFFFKKHTLPLKMRSMEWWFRRAVIFLSWWNQLLWCCYWFCGYKVFKHYNNIKRDNLRRILVIELKIDNSVFVLINIYNANTESAQLHTLNDLINILEIFEDIPNKSVVSGGDLNVILKPPLESEDCKPAIKKKTIAKLMQITENLDLCAIWRIRIPKRKQFTFRQHHSTGFIQRRLDCFFISNFLQESIKTADTLAAFSTDHSLKLFLYVI